MNKTQGFNGPVFDYAARPMIKLLQAEQTTESKSNVSSKPDSDKKVPNDEDIEGYNDDPNLTKVVDRRWYEKNKHIFPASVWEEFDPAKDYPKGQRKDVEGNRFFFS